MTPVLYPAFLFVLRNRSWTGKSAMEFTPVRLLSDANMVHKCLILRFRMLVGKGMPPLSENRTQRPTGDIFSSVRVSFLAAAHSLICDANFQLPGENKNRPKFFFGLFDILRYRFSRVPNAV